MAVTPAAGLNSSVVTGGIPVKVANGGVNGGYIVNPAASGDQGLAMTEVLYVDPVGPCGSLAANGTIIALRPGDTWALIPGQTTPTYVNAESSGHKFTVVVW
jgi:hypothetical protein